MEVQATICEGCLVLDDGATNHSYCKSFQSIEKMKAKKEQEEEERLRRKRIMNAILEEHYEGEASMNISVPAKKLKTSNKATKYKCLKCEFCTSDIERFKHHEVSGHAEPKLTNENFIFPKFVGFNCILRGSSYMEAPYFITEVKQLQQNNRHSNYNTTITSTNKRFFIR